MADREICGECKYHVYEEIDRGFVCTNPDSPYVTEWTEWGDGCRAGFFLIGPTGKDWGRCLPSAGAASLPSFTSMSL